MLADIMTGETELADVAFLAAFIVAVVAAVLGMGARSLTATLSATAFALVAFGLLAL